MFWFCYYILLALGEIDSECGAATLFTGHGDGAVMVTDYGLHDRQAEAGALLLGGVVGSEEAGTFFWSEAFTGVAHFDANGVRVVGGAKSECATSGHGIEGVEHEILESTVEKIGVGVDFRTAIP